jgi:hypothetical protein
MLLNVDDAFARSHTLPLTGLPQAEFPHALR